MAGFGNTLACHFLHPADEKQEQIMAEAATAAARQTSRRNVMRASVAAMVLALGRTPRALAADDEGGEVVPFLEPQPFDPKIAGLHWDELKMTDWLTPTPQVYHVKHYGDVK